MPLSLAKVMMVQRRDGRLLDEEMHAALDINIRNYTSAIMATNEVVESVSIRLRG